VWRVEKIPHYKDEVKHGIFVEGFNTAFNAWADSTKSQLESLQGNDADNASIANIIEHSFQTCLDEVTAKQLAANLLDLHPPHS
jgi:hypothetical protein